jgi:NCAIR mutase (PurE)-related protein
LFDNAQPESADIIGVVKAGTSEILVAENSPFCYK